MSVVLYCIVLDVLGQWHLAHYQPWQHKLQPHSQNHSKITSGLDLFFETICIVFIRGFVWFQLGINWTCFSSKCPSWSYIVRRFKNCSFETDNLSREKYSEITIVQNEQIQRYKFTLAAEIQKASSASVHYRNFSSRFYFELERFLHIFQNPKYANFG